MVKHILKQLKKDVESKDLVLISKSGDMYEIHFGLLVHRIRSELSFLKDLKRKIMCEKIHLSFEYLDGCVLENFVSLIYTGECFCQNKSDLEAVLE